MHATCWYVYTLSTQKSKGFKEIGKYIIYIYVHFTYILYFRRKHHSESFWRFLGNPCSTGWLSPKWKVSKWLEPGTEAGQLQAQTNRFTNLFEPATPGFRRMFGVACWVGYILFTFSVSLALTSGSSGAWLSNFYKVFAFLALEYPLRIQFWHSLSSILSFVSVDPAPGFGWP
jgi:hypothetical protein